MKSFCINFRTGDVAEPIGQEVVEAEYAPEAELILRNRLGWEKEILVVTEVPGA